MEDEKRVWKLSSNEIHTNRNREICLKIESEEHKNIHMETNMNEWIKLSINIFLSLMMWFFCQESTQDDHDLCIFHMHQKSTLISIVHSLDINISLQHYLTKSDDGILFSANLELILFPLLSIKQMPRDGINQSHATKPDWKCSESKLKNVLKVSRKLFCKAQAR